MKANEFEKLFEEGKDITQYLDLKKSKRPNQEQKRVSMSLPLWILHVLNKEAKRLGIPLQHVIKFRLAEYAENH